MLLQSNPFLILNSFCLSWHQGLETRVCTAVLRWRAGARNRVVARVAPAPGLALLHLHGEDRCLEHEGAEVARGTKYVLRSDVVFDAPQLNPLAAPS